MANLSNYAICYESIQRVYRNAVVRSMRKVLSEAYPGDWETKVAQLFSKEWAELQESAMERRRTGEISTTLTDSLDYLGVNHFYNLFERFFEVAFPRSPDVPDTTRQQERQAILGWAKGIKVLRDPTSHPSEQDLPFEDAFRMLDDARRLLLKLDQTSAGNISQLAKELSGAEAPTVEVELVRPALDGYLPPPESITTNFIGRQDELASLRTWFENPTTRLWALMGDGGKGKSAIAYEFGCGVRDKAPDPYEYVIWLSAKRRRFDEGIVQDIAQPDFTDLGTALDWILLHYGWASDAQNMEIEEKQQFCLQLLDEFPALLIVDDADSLEGESEAAVRFFTQRVATTKSKTIITSRRQLFGFGDITTEVKGFRDGEGITFINTRITLLSLDPRAFTKDICARILAVADGSPLYIEDLLRLCATGLAPADALTTWGEHGGGDAARRYALARELGMLTDNARQVLVAACVSNGPVSFVEIQNMTGMSVEMCSSSISELQRLFLVPKPKIIEEVERFDLNLNTRSLVKDTMGDSDMYRRIAGAYEHLSGDYNLSPARRARIGAYIRQAVGLVKQDRHSDAERTLLEGLTAYPSDPDLLGQMGWLYKIWKPQMRLADARDYFRRGRDLRCRSEEMYWHWSDMESAQREWTQAALASEAGLTIRPESKRLRFQAGYARSQLGKELAQALQPKAEEELLRAWKHLESALSPPEELDGYRERAMQSRIFRALVLTIDSVLRYASDENSRRIPLLDTNELVLLPSRRQCGESGLIILSRWTSEHPDDGMAQSEADRLWPRFSAAVN